MSKNNDYRKPLLASILERHREMKMLTSRGHQSFLNYSRRQKLVFLVSLLGSFFLLTRLYGSVKRLNMGVQLQLEENPLKQYAQAVIEDPVIAILIVVISVLIGRGISSLVRERGEKDPRGYKIAKSGTAGESRLMGDAEKHRVFALISKERPDGIILGKDKKTGELITMPWDTGFLEEPLTNRNIALFGPPGTRKTTGVLLPNVFNIFARGYSMGITDPKGEMYRETLAAAKYYNYNIKVFNILPGQFKFGDGWDLLKMIRDSDEPQSAADYAANIFMQNTGGMTGDSFWYDANINCLKLCLLYVAKGRGFIASTPANTKGETRTMLAVYELITAEDMPERIKTAIDVNPEDRKLLLQPYNIWSKHSQAESIRSGLGIRLGILQNESLARMLSEDEINFEELNDRPTVIYILCSDKDSTYKSILTLFTSFLFKTMTDIADSKDSGELDRRLYMIFEEMANIGKIPDLSKNVATLRSRGIAMIFCYQTLGQMIDVYGSLIGERHEWEVILGGCATLLCLGANDETSKKYFSERTGPMTIVDDSIAQSVSSISPIKFSPSERLTQMPRGRPVMYPDDIGKIKPSEILICLAGHNVTLEDKYYYKHHPMYNIRMVDAKGNPVVCHYRHHIPKWQRKEVYEADTKIPEYQRSLMQEDMLMPKYIKGFSKMNDDDNSRLSPLEKVLSPFFDFENEQNTPSHTSSKSYRAFLKRDTEEDEKKLY